MSKPPKLTRSESLSEFFYVAKDSSEKKETERSFIIKESLSLKQEFFSTLNYSVKELKFQIGKKGFIAELLVDQSIFPTTILSLHENYFEDSENKNETTTYDPTFYSEEGSQTISVLTKNSIEMTTFCEFLAENKLISKLTLTTILQHLAPSSIVDLAFKAV